MLTSAMGFAWDVIHTGERGLDRSMAIGIDDPEKPYAGVVETAVYEWRLVTLRLGESLEWAVNWLAIRLRYHDGEVSGMVAGLVR